MIRNFKYTNDVNGWNSNQVKKQGVKSKNKGSSRIFKVLIKTKLLIKGVRVEWHLVKAYLHINQYNSYTYEAIRF